MHFVNEHIFDEYTLMQNSVYVLSVLWLTCLRSTWRRPTTLSLSTPSFIPVLLQFEVLTVLPASTLRSARCIHDGDPVHSLGGHKRPSQFVWGWRSIQCPPRWKLFAIKKSTRVTSPWYCFLLLRKVSMMTPTFHYFHIAYLGLSEFCLQIHHTMIQPQKKTDISCPVAGHCRRSYASFV